VKLLIILSVLLSMLSAGEYASTLQFSGVDTTYKDKEIYIQSKFCNGGIHNSYLLPKSYTQFKALLAENPLFFC